MFTNKLGAFPITLLLSIVTLLNSIVTLLNSIVTVIIFIYYHDSATKTANNIINLMVD